jgi:predicted ATPase/DNA-binding CsgD family transcriptional regulator
MTGNLPRPTTELVGRTNQLRQLVEALRRRRLLTLTGPGGVGKTRLAVETGWLVVDEFSGGVWLVDLAAVTDPEAVLAAVASLFSIQPQRGLTMIESIVDWLRSQRLLLVVDNCEHVLASVVPLVDAVVSECPTVVVLATSREPLAVSGERVYPIAPLDPSSEAMELFCERALAADESFRPGPVERPVIIAICHRLDGMPLAIELAAARIRSLSPVDLLARLDDRFRLLHARNRRGLARHQTLEATVDWSYQLLSEPEQLLFSRVSVFAGGFDLDGALALCADAAADEVELLDMVSSLVEKSMVTVDRQGAAIRYRLLETLRQYGSERLTERGDTARRRDAHLTHFVDVANRARQLWFSSRQVDADALFDREWDNLRAAHWWAVFTRNLRAASMLIHATGPHAWCRSRHEHGEWAARTTSLRTADGDADPTAYGWAAYWSVVTGDYRHAIEMARHGIDVAPAPDHPETVLCWTALARSYSASADMAQSHQSVRAAQSAASSSSDLFAQVTADMVLIEDALATRLAGVDNDVRRYRARTERIGAPSLEARGALYEGHLRIREDPADAVGALAAFRYGLELARATGDINQENLMLWGGVYAAIRFQTADAPTVCRDALERFRATHYWHLALMAVDHVAAWLVATAQFQAAAVVYGFLDQNYPPSSEASRRRRAHGTAAVRPQPRAAQLMAEGAKMDREELVSFVLDHLAAPPDRPTQIIGWDALTAAERRVCALIGEGLTNREVARRLSISPETAKTHTAHILQKLGLRNRSQVAAEQARRAIAGG